MKILKQASTSFALQIKVPAEIAKRLSAAQTAARDRSLTFDIELPIAKLIARLVRQAEAELLHSQENPPAAPSGPLAAREILGEGVDHV